MTADRTPPDDPHEAIDIAKRARRSTEAVMPLVEDMAARTRRAIESNHFAELLEQTLREAAARR